MKDQFYHLPLAVIIHKFSYYNLLILDTSGCFVYFWQILHVNLILCVCFHSCIMQLYMKNVPLPTLIATGAHLMVTMTQDGITVIVGLCLHNK